MSPSPRVMDWRRDLETILANKFAGVVHNQDDGTWLAAAVIDALGVEQCAWQSEKHPRDLLALPNRPRSGWRPVFVLGVLKENRPCARDG